MAKSCIRLRATFIIRPGRQPGRGPCDTSNIALPEALDRSSAVTAAERGGYILPAICSSSRIVADRAMSSMDAGKLQDLIQLYRDMFVNCPDVCTVQFPEEGRRGVTTENQPFTDQLFQDHCEGRVTILLRAVSPTLEAKWMAIILRTTVVSEVQAILKKARALGLPHPLLEYPGRRGFRMFWFFSSPVSAKEARTLVRV